jgi:hypothetical protein
MKQGKQTGVLTSEFHFTKEELAVLDPMDKKKRELQKVINDFVSTKVIPRLFPDLDPNRRYNIKFDVLNNSIRIKDMQTRMDLTKENYSKVLGYGEKTPGR